MAKMTHPDSQQTIDVPPDQQPLYASAGWVRVDNKTVSTPEEAE